MMGFRMMDDDEIQPAVQLEFEQERHDEGEIAPLAPEDEVAGMDIGGDVQHDAGQAVEGQLVYADRGDHLNVNGIELFPTSALANLREACAFYSLSQSGGKERCFKRLWEHQKKLELQTALSAARETEAEQQRKPNPQKLAEPPDEKSQQLHMLTHLPFQEWCAHCVAHRSRPDRHKRDGQVKESGVPTVSFDFAYTKAVAPGGNAQDTDQVIALVLVDSMTNYTGCVPISKKNDFDLMVREILQFTQVLGHSECTYLCDNEPSILQVQKRAVQARQMMGLVTHSKTPAAYDHGNSLCENTVNRVRGLAGTLMHSVQERLSIKLNTDHGLWSWALRHSSWLLNRFAVVHGATPYELVYHKVYKGKMTEFAEPAFAYTHTVLKGNPRWQRVIVLGKTEAQDTYVVFTGQSVMLTRSIRRISTDWKCHLGFYLHFNAPTWRFKAGFGGRVVPTKRAVPAKSASFSLPQGPVLPSPLHDKDAEDVKQKKVEEQAEEREAFSMGQHDQRAEPKQYDVEQLEGMHDDSVTMQHGTGVDVDAPSFAARPKRPGEVEVTSVFDDVVADSSLLSSMEAQVDSPSDPGLAAPVTPPVIALQLPPTPRQQHATRTHGDDVEENHEAKRAKLESLKKQKINQLRESHEAMIRTVKVGSDEYATMDDYENEVDMDDGPDTEYWEDEDQLTFSDVPDALWCAGSLEKQPQAPESWVDQLADQVEISRLLSMGVLQRKEECLDEISGSLTTRFVYDWRIKDHPNGTKQWMRRSRFVAREFATDKRSDTYSPASGCHSVNLIPICYLKMLAESLDSAERFDEDSSSPYRVVLAALDIKDAFLQVPQENLVMVSLYNQQYVIRRNLPGQRLGAKAWYWHFRRYISDALNCCWCLEQPCLAKCVDDGTNNCFLIHVDDLLFAGSYSFWTTKFLPAVTSKFNVNYTELKENGSFISFLKRKLVKIKDGLLLVPGTTANKVVSYFEKFFGVAKQQKIPCDGSIQNDDKSQKLSDGDSKAYRSVIGLLLYVARDRVDVMFAVKELSAHMSAPTVCALQKLRKLIGYLKANGDMGIKLCIPEFGAGKWKRGGEKFWNVETFTDADWSAHKTHRRSTSCAVHFINNNLAYASSRTQRVVSLSSAESELHSMVSGCSDAIFLRRCMEFLTGDEIEQWQWVDNSAARQLIERQGVGRVRHLSGKILWMQSLVLEKQIKLGQVPTQWNVSDVGTKPLAKQRLLVLLHQIGCCNPDTHEMVGQEEYEAFEGRTVGKQMVKRMAKTIMRMAVLWGLEPNLQGAEAATVDEEVCQQVQASGNNGGNTWLWFSVFLLFMLWVGLAVAGYVAWKKFAKTTKDLESCWNQVADEDSYIAKQEARIDQVIQRLEQIREHNEQDHAIISDRVTECSNELSMVHDYASGLHYSIVEHGGFLRNGCGLSPEQWRHLATLERANLVSSRALGAVEYMRLVRQRFQPQGTADATDSPNAEADDPMDESEPEVPSGPISDETLTDMLEFLKGEHGLCLERSEYWDANEVQHVILHFLSEIHHSSAESLVASCRVRIAGLFGELKDKAIEQHRWDSADRYQAIERRYMPNPPA